MPPEVLSKATVEEQIEEMQKWFKAFQVQDKSSRVFGDRVDRDYKYV